MQQEDRTATLRADLLGGLARFVGFTGLLVVLQTFAVAIKGPGLFHPWSLGGLAAAELGGAIVAGAAAGFFRAKVNDSLPIRLTVGGAVGMVWLPLLMHPFIQHSTLLSDLSMWALFGLVLGAAGAQNFWRYGRI